MIFFLLRLAAAVAIIACEFVVVIDELLET